MKHGSIIIFFNFVLTLNTPIPQTVMYWCDQCYCKAFQKVTTAKYMHFRNMGKKTNLTIRAVQGKGITFLQACIFIHIFPTLPFYSMVLSRRHSGLVIPAHKVPFILKSSTYVPRPFHHIHLYANQLVLGSRLIPHDGVDLSP